MLMATLTTLLFIESKMKVISITGNTWIPRSGLKGEIASMGVIGGNGVDVGGTGLGAPAPEAPKKEKKVPPMSKQLASKLSQCSQRLSEIVSWEAKLADATGTLSLI